ncbi:hypothetical protein AB0H34_30580 [Saccharopolyspora shandongensis]|uniref:hypothetical protein n=1 Tax=Saccharopolyspora shandongensis TaxID=418495 RepID=UPI0033E12D6B
MAQRRARRTALAQGSGAGYFTVHRGDIGSSRDGAHLIDTVHIGHGRADETNVAGRRTSAPTGHLKIPFSSGA